MFQGRRKPSGFSVRSEKGQGVLRTHTRPRVSERPEGWSAHRGRREDFRVSETESIPATFTILIFPSRTSKMPSAVRGAGRALRAIRRRAQAGRKGNLRGKGPRSTGSRTLPDNICPFSRANGIAAAEPRPRGFERPIAPAFSPSTFEMPDSSRRHTVDNLVRRISARELMVTRGGSALKTR